MKRLLMYGGLAMAIMLTGCKKDVKDSASTDPVQQPTPQVRIEIPNDGGPDDVKGIQAYVDSVEKVLPLLGVRGPQTVMLGDRVAEAKVYSGEDDTPLLIYCQLREVEQWYFLWKRRLLSYRERKPGKKGYEEQRWYYTRDAAIKGELLNAANPAAFASAARKDIPLSKITSDVVLEEVNLRIFEILYGNAPR